MLVKKLYSLLVVVSLFASPISFRAYSQPDDTKKNNVQDKLKRLSRQAEVISDKVNGLVEQRDKALSEIDQLKRDIQKNNEEIGVLKVNIVKVKPAVKKFIKAEYQGRRLNNVSAFLLTNSPQQLLDQMVIIQQVSELMNNKVSTLRNSKSLLDNLNSRNNKLIKRRQYSLKNYEQLIADLTEKKNDLDSKIYRIKAYYNLLTPIEKVDYANGSGLSPAELRARLASLPIGRGAAAIAVSMALRQVGKPYVWGGTNPNVGFDCSGLMVWSYAQAGVGLPRTSQSQAGTGIPVPRSALAPGDIIVYYSDASHVGLYIGNGMVVHAPTFGMPVQVVPLDGAGPYAGARRVVR